MPNSHPSPECMQCPQKPCRRHRCQRVQFTGFSTPAKPLGTMAQITLQFCFFFNFFLSPSELKSNQNCSISSPCLSVCVHRAIQAGPKIVDSPQTPHHWPPLENLSAKCQLQSVNLPAPVDPPERCCRAPVTTLLLFFVNRVPSVDLSINFQPSSTPFPGSSPFRTTKLQRFSSSFWQL